MLTLCLRLGIYVNGVEAPKGVALGNLNDRSDAERTRHVYANDSCRAVRLFTRAFACSFTRGGCGSSRNKQFTEDSVYR